MVKLVPECTKCGSSVTDLVEPEIEEHGQLKRGRYVNSIWICNDCIENEREEEKLSSIIKQKSPNHQSENMDVASPSDVSPNSTKGG